MVEAGRRFIVRGRVQGVSYRVFARRAANDLGGLRGQVRNLSDGTVEVQVAGTEETLGRLREKLARGPAWGRVDGIDEQAIDPDPAWEGFVIRF